MVEFPSPTPLWTERRWFRGVFVQGDRSEGPFQIGIDLDTAGTSSPVGYVIGDDAVAARLRLLSDTPLHIVSVADEAPRIHVEGVHLGTIYTKAGAGETLHRLTGRFSATTVVRHEEHPRAAQPQAVFLVNGPNRFWPAWHPWQSEQYEDATFALDNLTIEAQPLTYESGKGGWQEPPLRVMQLTVRDNEPSSAEPDRFFAEATEAVDDVLTLMSLLHRGRIHWHERHLYANDTRTQTNRNHVNLRPHREERDDWEQLIIDSRKRYDFLRIGRTRLRQWREDGHPLELPIAYRLNGARRGGATITQMFTSLFLSLESLTAIHAERRELQPIVSWNHFKKQIRPSLQQAVGQLEGLTDDQRDAMNKKLIELNRRNLREVVEHCAAEYGVTWADLYPKGDPPDKVADFIAARNKLFHGAAAVSEHRVAAEIERLQLFLDRLLLRMVGWEDLSHVWPAHIELLRHKWALEPIE